MRKLIFNLLAVSAFALLFVSCSKEEEKTYDASMVVGKWQKASSNEYWRYNSDKTGDFWDEDEDVQEGEGTHFQWSVSGDELRLTFVGEMGQEVPRDYKIKELTVSLMRLEDVGYGTETTYYKK